MVWFSFEIVLLFGELTQIKVGIISPFEFMICKIVDYSLESSKGVYSGSPFLLIIPFSSK